MPRNNHIKSFIHGSAISMIGLVFLGIANYLIRKILEANLSTEEYGFFYSVLAVIMIVMVFIDLGLAQAVTITTSKCLATNDKFAASKVYTINLFLKLSLAIPIFLIMELLAPTLNAHFWKFPAGNIALFIMLFLIPFLAVQSAPSSVMQAFKAFGTATLLDCIKAVIILTCFLLFTQTYGLTAAAIIFVSAGIFTFIIGCRWVTKRKIKLISFRNINTIEVKKLFSLSSWIAISSAGISIMYYMDTTCLTWLKDLRSVGLYNIALPIMQIAQSFFVFPAILIPFVAEMHHNGNIRGIKKACIAGNILMLLTLPFFLLVGHFFAEDIITLLFSSKSVAAAPAVTILWSGMVFFSMANLNLAVMNSSGKQKTAAFMIFGCVIVNFVLNVIFIPHFDFIGAALATAITYLIMAICSIVILSIMLRETQGGDCKHV